jgi:hypothetical protein
MSNEEWRLGLNYLLERSGLVIINPLLMSASLEWEISRCIERALDKVVILTWHERFDYTKFCDSVERLFPHGLPALADPTHLQTFRPWRSTWWQARWIRVRIRFTPLWLLLSIDFADGVISFDRQGRGRHMILSAMSMPLALLTGRTARDYRRRLRAFLREKGLEPRDTSSDRIKRVAMNDLAHPARSWILSMVGGYVAVWVWKAWVLYGRCQTYGCRWWIPPYWGD